MNVRPLVAEFIGTFALIFVGIALAHGLTIAVMVSATAAISGGHLNPAVTIAALVGGKIDARGALAGLVYHNVLETR